MTGQFRTLAMFLKDCTLMQNFINRWWEVVPNFDNTRWKAFMSLHYYLVLFLLPPPQLVVHADHFPHAPILQSTEVTKNYPSIQSYVEWEVQITSSTSKVSFTWLSGFEKAQNGRTSSNGNATDDQKKRNSNNNLPECLWETKSRIL